MKETLEKNEVALQGQPMHKQRMKRQKFHDSGLDAFTSVA
jgi:hypothetical protein